MSYLAFLFPGQGSQFEGMGQDLCEQSTLAKELFEQAGHILGWPPLELKKQADGPSLNTTLYTQPAIYTVSCSIAAILKENGIEPDVAAGHSAGEYAALTSASAWDFETGLKVIAERARLMRESKTPGAMAAVLGAAPEVIQEACNNFQDGIVVAANLNSPKQTVISGEADAIDAIVPILKEKGARRVMKLSVSGAFHSPLMKDAQEEFRTFLQSIEINPLQTVWISNNTAQPESEPESIRERLAAQFCSPVRWVETMQRLDAECERAVEIGPGEVLCGLTKACCEKLSCQPTSTWEGLLEIQNDYVTVTGR